MASTRRKREKAKQQTSGVRQTPLFVSRKSTVSLFILKTRTVQEQKVEREIDATTNENHNTIKARYDDKKCLIFPAVTPLTIIGHTRDDGNRLDTPVNGKVSDAEYPLQYGIGNSSLSYHYCCWNHCHNRVLLPRNLLPGNSRG